MKMWFCGIVYCFSFAKHRFFRIFDTQYMAHTKKNIKNRKIEEKHSNAREEEKMRYVKTAWILLFCL